MSRKKTGLQVPGRFIFVTEEITGRHFRRYCFEHDLSLEQALEEAVIDFLIKVEQIPNRESLEIEIQMND